MQVAEPGTPIKATRDDTWDVDREAIALLRGSRVGSLAVVEAGAPKLALVTPAIALDGAPLVLLSRLSAHTRALDRDPACAMMLTGAPSEANPQTAPRLSLGGHAARADDPHLRARYLAIHPYAAMYVDFADFGLFRMTVTEARYVGGFARAAKLDPARLAPPAASAAEFALVNDQLIATLNETNADALNRIAGASGAEPGGWRIVAIDPDGLDLGRGEHVRRVDFDRPIGDPAEIVHEIGRIAARTQG